MWFFQNNMCNKMILCVYMYNKMTSGKNASVIFTTDWDDGSWFWLSLSFHSLFSKLFLTINICIESGEKNHFKLLWGSWRKIIGVKYGWENPAVWKSLEASDKHKTQLVWTEMLYNLNSLPSLLKWKRNGGKHLFKIRRLPSIFWIELKKFQKQISSNSYYFWIPWLHVPQES